MASTMAVDAPYSIDRAVMASAAAEEDIERSASSASINTATEGDERSLENEIRSDIRALKARGLPAGHGLALTWKNLSIRGEGGGLDIHYLTDLGTLLFPWTNIIAKRRIRKLQQRIVEKNPEATNQSHRGTKAKRGEPGLRRGQRYLINDFTGCLQPGEMMLVVGRPGSGCTTFLKSLAGLTSSYAGVDGQVWYGSLESGSRQFAPLRGDVVFNGEEDTHDPNLQVGRTMDFALRMETPSQNARPLDPTTGKPVSASSWRKTMKLKILNALGIAHTERTKVGNQYVRGVSGGERKRVSLAEVLTTNAQIFVWDNATRGLDASSALEFSRLCRKLSDGANRINILTLYQAGNGIYDQFDKVTVIAEGLVIYYGPRHQARAYFEEMGFEHMEGANTADFLTAVTALNERKVRPEFKDKVPNTATEFAKVYRESKICAHMEHETTLLLDDREAREAETLAQKELVAAEKSPKAIQRSAQKASPLAQVYALTIKEAQARWGDKPSLIARQGTTFIMAFVAGSVFYQCPDNSHGLFLLGGLFFMIILFPSILSFADVQAAFVGRNVTSKHKSYSMYLPANMILAQTIVDIPILFFQIVIWTIVMYFMGDTHSNARHYFITLLFSFVVTCCNTALFRTIGFMSPDYNIASMLAGSIFMIFILYSGYIIYTPSMKPWFGWTRFLNPVYYGIEAVCATIFPGITFLCVPPDIAPYGPGYQNGPQGCSVAGSTPGSISIDGEHYINVALGFKTKYETLLHGLLTVQHIWRNLGIIFGLWINSAFLGMLALTILPSAGDSKKITLFKRGGGGRYMKMQLENIDGGGPRDEEHAGIAETPTEEPLVRWGTTHTQVTTREWPALSRCASVCSAGVISSPRARLRLQEKGATGNLTPMMEKPTTSGPESRSDSSSHTHTVIEEPATGVNDFKEKAPKTRSVDDEAPEVRGTTFTWKDLDYTVKESGKDKQLLRKVTGYCKAGTITALMGSSGAGKTTLMDVLAARKDEGVIHGQVLLNGKPLPKSFQRTTGYCEQVDVHMPQATVREALEFSALLRQPRHISRADKLAYVDEIIDLLELQDLEDAIIGVPGVGLDVEQRKRVTIGVELVSRPTLLFLDEPTSGLDGQSSYKIVGFLQKLASTGQAIMCTIHQPSAALFAGFDMLLLLKEGGRTVYMGAIEEVPKYFINKGVEWPASVNPAEFMIDIVSGPLSRDRDWSSVWDNSDERDDMLQELEHIKNTCLVDEQTNGVEKTEEYASPTSTQLWLVYVRANVQLWRNVAYVINKFLLHIVSALLLGFSFWKIGNSVGDLKNRVFTLFQFAFVAPSVIVQIQPKFIANRDIFEAREKKAKFYSWQVFCFGEIAAEFPYLLICAFLFWCCWYPATGLSLEGNIAGPVFLCMCFYEFLYTGLGQFIAAYAPNALFAALVVPLIILILAIFCGIIVPYAALNVFWRYWMYYLDPFTYLMKGLITFPVWDVGVRCLPAEYGYFDPPSGQTCGQYMAEFLKTATGYLDNPDATTQCAYCTYKKGSEYLASLNINRRVIGWEGIFLTLLFAISSYALVFILLKLRSKASKTAS